MAAFCKQNQHQLFFTLLLAFATLRIATAGDADIATPAKCYKHHRWKLFTDRAMRAQVNAEPPKTFKVFKVSINEFPTLNGQSVSYAVLQFPAGAVNPPHTHPRSAELLFLIDGWLEVGFVDTTNKLFTQTLQAGDLFVFPKGLVHYQYNGDNKNSAIAVSAFVAQMLELCQFLVQFSLLGLMTIFWPRLSRLMSPPFKQS